MYTPDRNVLAGGLTGVIGWGLMWIAGATGHPVDPITANGVLMVVAFGIAHFVPPSAQNIVNKLNDEIVHMAQIDPDSNVSYVLPPVRVPVGEPVFIGGPPSAGGTPQLVNVPSPVGIKPSA